jgi:hypothetical protein
VADSNTEQDNPALPYHHEYHFDRNDSMSHAAAFFDGVQYVRGQMALVKQFAMSNPREALNALGRALHAQQDFYAHSNFIELSPLDRDTIESALLQQEGAIYAPSTLKLTWFNPNSMSDINDPLGYPHHLYAKDFPLADRLGVYFQALAAASSASHKLVETARGLFSSDQSPSCTRDPAPPTGLSL